MIERPEAFCPKCYEKVDYILCSGFRTIEINGVTFEYDHMDAYCKQCGTNVHPLPIEDRNRYNRHKAYYNKLCEYKGANERK